MYLQCRSTLGVPHDQMFGLKTTLQNVAPERGEQCTLYQGTSDKRVPVRTAGRDNSTAILLIQLRRFRHENTIRKTYDLVYRLGREGTTPSIFVLEHGVLIQLSNVNTATRWAAVFPVDIDPDDEM